GHYVEMPEYPNTIYEDICFEIIKIFYSFVYLFGMDVIKVKQKFPTMTTISLHSLTERLKSGYMTLTGEYGRKYRNQALFVPNYGWVPCSRKLQSNFTTNPSELMVVISDADDRFRPVTSDIWVTRSNILTVF
ncbi:hypothetical protein, partial [uncultured Muribaculum sp.]|uniref:hypothetical protein n=1 Tax=uncultured Muribaculum sp. TaxID=1918613 RepID=UPI00272FCB42